MRRRLDLRDVYLRDKGIMALFLGYAYTFAPVPRLTRNQLSTVSEYVPLHVLGLAWVVAGCYCIVAAYCRRTIGGWAVGVFMPIIWGLLYLICCLNGDPGRGWVATGIFWSIARAMYAASGMVDPHPVPRRNRETGRR